VTAALQLRRLQDVDTRIAAIRAEIASIESTLGGDPELDRRSEGAAAATRERHEAEAAAAAGEAEMNALQTRVRQLDRRLYGGSVHNPAELVDMQHELEALRARAAAAEEGALALLEAAESATAAEAEAGRELRTVEERRAQQEGPLREQLAQLAEGLTAAGAEREAVAGALDARDLALYARVTAHRQPAVVQLVGDACGGCHLPVSIEERRAVRTGSGVVQCPNCDRILVA
jgi:predicted  nucleic acid-binding Zn-ribbon protein